MHCAKGRRFEWMERISPVLPRGRTTRRRRRRERVIRRWVQAGFSTENCSPPRRRRRRRLRPLGAVWLRPPLPPPSSLPPPSPLSRNEGKRILLALARFNVTAKDFTALVEISVGVDYLSTGFALACCIVGISRRRMAHPHTRGRDGNNYYRTYVA